MRSVSGLLLLVVAGCGMLEVGVYPRTTIPAEIAAPANQRLALVAVANGVQAYRCDPRPDAPGRFEWAYQAPEAWLRDVAGKSLGRHYAGPTWELTDGSKVVGTEQARVAAAGKSDIPWLRLAARSTGGAGLLANVTGIQQVNTSGGRAPAAGCTQPDQGRILRVEFTADYNFYVPR